MAALNGVQQPSSIVGNDGDSFTDSAHNKVYNKANGAWSLVLDPDNLSSIALTSAHILVGNASNVATDVALSGDISVTNAGVSAIGANKVVVTSMLSQIATASLLGRSTAGTGNVEVITKASLPVSTATQAALDLKQDLNPAVSDIAGTTYTFVLADNGKTKTTSNGSAVTITIPLNASVAFPIGATLIVDQRGAGKVSFVNGGGITIESIAGNLSISAQYGWATLTKLGTDTWGLSGSLSA